MSSKYLNYAKNLTTYFGASIIPMLLNLATNPLIAKNMSPEDYAVSGYFQSFNTLIAPIIVFYMVHYYIKEYFKRDEAGRERLYAVISKALIWFSGLVSIVCFGILFIYLKFFNHDLLFPIMPYLGMTIFSLPLTGLYSLQQSRYRMEKRSRDFFWLSMGNSLLALSLVLLFVVIFKWGAFGKLLAPLLGNFAIFVYMLFTRRGIWKIKNTFAEFKPIFIFCLPLALSAMLGYFTNGFSTTYLESIGNTTEYGIYIVGNSIAGYLSVFATAINNTFTPDLYETTIKRQWGRYAKFCCLQIFLIAAVVAAFILVAPFVISILTAGRYVASTPYAKIIALSTIASSIYYLINNFSIATNRPKLYLYTSILGSLFIVVAMPYAVDRWSYFGGAWMSGLSFLAFAIINLTLLFFIPQKVKA